MSPKLNNLIVRAISGALFVAIMVAGMLQPLALVFLFSLIAGMAVWEFCSLANDRPQVSVNRFICSAAAMFLVIAVAGFCSGVTDASVFIPYLITVVYLFVGELFLKNEDPVHSWAYSTMSQMYIALPLSTISMLAFRATPAGVPCFHWILPLSVFVFLWCNDTGAYLSGSLFGRHKLFPRVSPGKTWEGSIGGAILVMAVAAVVSQVEPQNAAGQPLSGLTTLQWMGLGLMVVVFGTLGDLVESLLKRTLGIKDSGNIMPGHGGMLDRFDSSLLAIPAAVVYLYTCASLGI